MANHSIFIAGAGGIGRAAGLLIRKLGDIDADLWVGDISQSAVDEAVAFIQADTSADGIHGLVMPPDHDSATLEAACKGSDVLLDCLPGSHAPRMAQLARKYKMHYANLTEYVHETAEIRKIAEGAETGFVLQTGLAPGFVGVLAMSLYNDFRERYQVDKLEYISMKVGALTRSANPPHYYGFTWSPIGVATEYVKPAIVIRDFKMTTAPSLAEREELIIDGLRYEADLTSGGAADLPEALEGKVRRLDYKTLRWPGHYGWVEHQLSQISGNGQQSLELEGRMLSQIPMEEDDVVIIQAYVIGKDRKGNLRQHGRSYKINPMTLGGQTMRAIQSTTAAPMVECARMLLTGKYKGVVLQSQLNPKEFLEGPFVKAVYG